MQSTYGYVDVSSIIFAWNEGLIYGGRKLPAEAVRACSFVYTTPLEELHKINV